MKERILFFGLLLFAIANLATAGTKGDDGIKLYYVNYPQVAKGVDFELTYEYNLESFKCVWKSRKQPDKDIALKAANAKIALAKKGLSIATTAEDKTKAQKLKKEGESDLVAAEKKTNKYFYDYTVSCEKKVVILEKGTQNVLAKSDWIVGTKEKKNYEKFTDASAFAKFDKDGAAAAIKKEVEAGELKLPSDDTGAEKAKLTEFKLRSVVLEEVSVKGSKKKIADILAKVEELNGCIAEYNSSGSTPAMVKKAEAFVAFFNEKIGAYEAGNKKAIINDKNVDALIYYKAISQFMAADYQGAEKTVASYKTDNLKKETVAFTDFFGAFYKGYKATSESYAKVAPFVGAKMSVNSQIELLATNYSMQQVFDLPISFNFVAELPANVKEITYEVTNKGTQMGTIEVSQKGVKLKKSIKPKVSANVDGLSGFIDSKSEKNDYYLYKDIKASHSPTFGKGFSHRFGIYYKYENRAFEFAVGSKGEVAGNVSFDENMLIKSVAQTKGQNYACTYENGMLSSVIVDDKAVEVKYDKADKDAWTSVEFGEVTIKRTIK